MSVPELEQRTCHAFGLASRWLSGHLSPRRPMYIYTTCSVPVSDVKFLPGRCGDWVLTVSKGVWDVLTIWNLASDERRRQKTCEWCSRGAIFNGVALNTDPESDATLAVSVLNDGSVAQTERLTSFLSLYPEITLCTFFHYGATRMAHSRFRKLSRSPPT